jgi:hypothetical protein
VIRIKEKEGAKSEPIGVDISLHCSYWFALDLVLFLRGLLYYREDGRGRFLLRHYYEGVCALVMRK